MPLPRAETTPPVTKTNRVCGRLWGIRVSGVSTIPGAPAGPPSADRRRLRPHVVPLVALVDFAVEVRDRLGRLLLAADRVAARLAGARREPGEGEVPDPRQPDPERAGGPAGLVRDRELVGVELGQDEVRLSRRWGRWRWRWRWRGADPE